MSIALERGSGFMRGGRMSCIAAVFESPETAGDRMFPARKVEETGDRDSCSSSSIGRNSDDSSGLSSDGEGSGEGEVQSAFKGPLETMDSLEDVLPIRKGISKFYCGKSKSFTSLADVSSASSIKDIAKPDNPYSRKRKNLLACSSAFLESRNRSFPLRGNSGGSISKRPANGSRSTLALAMAMNSSDGPNNNNNNNNGDNSNSNSTSNSSSASPSPPRLLPPLHPRAKQSLDNTAPSPPLRRSFSPWRSFSLTDLQSASSDNAAPITDTSPSSMNKRGNLNCLH